jgi:hypothetical protein
MINDSVVCSGTMSRLHHDIKCSCFENVGSNMCSQDIKWVGRKRGPWYPKLIPSFKVDKISNLKRE